MRLKLPFEKVEISEMTIAVPVGERVNEFKGVAKMNGTTVFLFDLLKNDITEEELIQELEKKYDASREVLTTDVRKCVELLREKGLLIA